MFYLIQVNVFKLLVVHSRCLKSLMFILIMKKKKKCYLGHWSLFSTFAAFCFSLSIFFIPLAIAFIFFKQWSKMNLLPLVLVNSMYVRNEQQRREGGTEKAEDCNQGSEIYYVRFLLNVCAKHTTDRHIPFWRNFRNKILVLYQHCKTVFKTLK